jgi:hypothetical protein
MQVTLSAPILRIGQFRAPMCRHQDRSEWRPFAARHRRLARRARGAQGRHRRCHDLPEGIGLSRFFFFFFWGVFFFFSFGFFWAEIDDEKGIVPTLYFPPFLFPLPFF